MDNTLLTISNADGSLTLHVDVTHAEPVALVDKNGRNLLWHGDVAYWDKHDPILFPTVGKSHDERIIVEGQCYPMPKHGFAMRETWQVVEYVQQEGASGVLVLALCDSPVTRVHYPFPFRVEQRYEFVDGCSLQVSWKVSSEVRLPFMMGAHPAFVLPDFCADDEVHGYLQLDVPQLWSHRVQPDGFLHDDTTLVQLDEEHLLPLTNTTFEADTLLDLEGKNHLVALFDKHKRRILTLHHTMPVLALWAPKHGCCPFVCIEPWSGACDVPGYQGEFAERQFVQFATPEQAWTTHYTIVVE